MESQKHPFVGGSGEEPAFSASNFSWMGQDYIARTFVQLEANGNHANKHGAEPVTRQLMQMNSPLHFSQMRTV
jgi:hypothetical protein